VNSRSAALALGASSGRTFLGHPLGLATVFFVEMWERMSFYGMRALLILFLVDQVAHHGMGLDDRTAASIYGLYVGGTYLACLPGGWIGDRVLGAQRAVLWGGIVITLGHLLLGVAPSSKVFFLGLLIIVLGTGLLKTNAGAIVAQLYPEGGARRDAGFTIYYIGVNVGGMIGPLITGWLALTYGWSAGFFAAALGMTAGVLQFLWGRSLLRGAGLQPSAQQSDQSAAPRAALRWLTIGVGALLALALLIWTGVLQIAPQALEAASTRSVGAVALLYFLYLLFGAGLTRAEQLRVVVVLILFIASVLFWAGDEQAGSSLNLFAERYTDRQLWHHIVPAEWFQSLNSVFIILFGSLFSAVWIALARRGRDPSTGMKFVFGLLGVAAGFAVMAAASRLVVSGHKVGMQWLTATYLLHTWGELCLSPVGLSAVTKLVPPRFCGQSLGIFFVSLSLGNLLAGRIAGDFDPSNVSAMPGQFMYIFWFCGLCAAAVAVLLPLMRRWAGGVT
jgi:proton-dependent oligopeptide transporter, POT family